uniref:G protein-coupled receptor n=1 Tax=Panagrolaimus sp. JU765 TaxID=591449 RepID=A0AC34RKE8_9BILA
MILETNTSIMGFGLLSLIMYRYHSIRGTLQTLTNKFSIPLFFLASLVYPIPVLALNFLAITGRTANEVAESLEKIAPQYVEIAKLGICANTTKKLEVYIYLAVTALQICLIYAVGIYFSTKTILSLRELKHTFSPTTYVVQKQFIISMFVQTAVPIFCYMIPIGIILFAVACGFDSTG